MLQSNTLLFLPLSLSRRLLRSLLCDIFFRLNDEIVSKKAVFILLWHHRVFTSNSVPWRTPADVGQKSCVCCVVRHTARYVRWGCCQEHNLSRLMGNYLCLSLTPSDTWPIMTRIPHALLKHTKTVSHPRLGHSVFTANPCASFAKWAVFSVCFQGWVVRGSKWPR